MNKSSSRVRAASVVTLAGLAITIFAGACSRNNESTGQSNRGATQTQASDSATQYNTDQNMSGTTTGLQKDLADFRTQVDKKVADNARAINDKRADLANATSSMRVEFQKMLDDAEAHNNEIRDRVLNYTPTDRTAWDQFRNDTNQALDDIAASIGKIDVK